MMKATTIHIKIALLCIICIYTAMPLSAQQFKNLTILQTSDTHSQITPIEQKGDVYYNKGGFARRAAMINEMRKTTPNLLLFDCGDFSQGSLYYSFFKGNAEIDLMNEMKYDVATIGNHEFDFGMTNMLRLFKKATFPIVCANYDFSSTILKKIVKPYVVLVRNGLRIGVFGLSPKLDGLVQKKNYGKIKYNDPLPIANNISRILKNKEKCDVVICLSHLGIYTDKELIKNSENIDLVLGGHTHTFMKEAEPCINKDGKTVMLSHTGARGVDVGKIELRLEKK